MNGQMSGGAMATGAVRMPQDPDYEGAAISRLGIAGDGTVDLDQRRRGLDVRNHLPEKLRHGSCRQ